MPLLDHLRLQTQVKHNADDGPNLLLIGAPRSGTSFLHQRLAGHPEIFAPRIKEPHFHLADRWPLGGPEADAFRQPIAEFVAGRRRSVWGGLLEDEAVMFSRTSGAIANNPPLIHRVRSIVFSSIARIMSPSSDNSPQGRRGLTVSTATVASCAWRNDNRSWGSASHTMSVYDSSATEPISSGDRRTRLERLIVRWGLARVARRNPHSEAGSVRGRVTLARFVLMGERAPREVDSTGVSSSRMADIRRRVGSIVTRIRR